MNWKMNTIKSNFGNLISLSHSFEKEKRNPHFIFMCIQNRENITIGGDVEVWNIFDSAMTYVQW